MIQQMHRWMMGLWLGLLLLGAAVVDVSAADTKDAAAGVSKEEKEIAEMAELLEMMELLRNMELLADYEIIGKEKTDEKND